MNDLATPLSPPPGASQPVPSGPRRSGPLRRLLWIALPVIVLAGGLFLASFLMKTSPKAERRPTPRVARLVEVLTLHPEDRQVNVPGMGLVQAARSVPLRPLVGGEIVRADPNFIPGGFFSGGQTLLQIDPQDYLLAIQRQEAEVARAVSTLRLEEGQQDIARQDFALLQDTATEDDLEFVLRKPQKASAEAQLAGARAQLDAARLDLERATVRAPFNALVVERFVNLGTVVNASTVLARLAGTDEFWVELTVPVDTLRWIEIPARPGDPASTVRLYDEAAWGPEIHREGTVLRLTGEVDPQSRLARLIVAVPDPIGLETASAGLPRLLLNAFVRADILGRTLPGIYAVPREYLHEGDTVWIMNDESRLEIRPLDVIYRGPTEVYVNRGLDPGTRLVTTNLAAPVEGMALRLGSALGDALAQPPFDRETAPSTGAASTPRGPAPGQGPRPQPTPPGNP